MKEWYAPREIHYLPEHIEWILLNLNMLLEGYWPPNPQQTGYTDVQGSKRGHSAYFEVPVCIAAEVTYRLKKCGADGILARKCLADGWDEQTLAEIMHVDIKRITTRVRRVVNYCSGVRRRRMAFIEFKRRAGIRDSYRQKSNHT